MNNFVKLTISYNNEPTWIDISRVRQMSKALSYHYRVAKSAFDDAQQKYAQYLNPNLAPKKRMFGGAAISASDANVPPPQPVAPNLEYATCLYFENDDYVEVTETPEEILRLAKGLAPSIGSGFSMEELESAQDLINGHAKTEQWSGMWKKPFTAEEN